MKTLLKRILPILLVCLLLVPAFALAEGPDGAKLTVRGTATIRVAPDRASLSMGYYAEDMDITKAQADTSAKVAAIIAAVKALGVKDDQIMTTYLNIGPVYNYNDGTEKLRGYRVEHMLEITVSDLTNVAAIMDAALTAGANNSNGITFQSSTESDSYRTALEQAIAAAQSKAEVMAKAAGKQIKTLETLSEITDSYYGPLYSNAKTDMAAGSLGGTIMSGAIQVNATVEMVFEVE